MFEKVKDGNVDDDDSGSKRMMKMGQLKKCDLKSCGKMERVVDTFLICPRCGDRRYCCEAHRVVAW